MMTNKPEVAAPVRSAIEACLAGFGYEFLTHRRTGDIRFWCQTLDVSYRCQFIINEKERLLRLFVFTDDLFAAEQRQEVYELVHRLNEQVVLGCFGVMWNKQEVFFRNSLDFRSHDPNVEAVKNMMEAGVFPLALWEKSYSYLMDNKADPKTALEAAMMYLNVVEDDQDVSKMAKKIVLKAEVGGGSSSTSHTPDLKVV